MCGIAGIIGATSREETARRLNRMLDVQEHRGPDDRGVWMHESVAFGHLRLSIIDLSPAGHQPMSVDEGRLVLTFNGEIFNYIELRNELSALGHSFISTSDTEVIIRAYDEWGVDCCSRFNGMWAFALYDRERRRVICSRDRFGVKPFHYAARNSEVLFSSEIKGILAGEPSLNQPDDAHIARYLRTSLVNDTDSTFFTGVKSLPPGHTMVIDVSGGTPALGAPIPYWSFDAERSRATYDYANPIHQMRELLADAVSIRLRADVPVGTCLSGGLDSSSIVAAAAKELQGPPVWTFSSLYPQQEFDESRYVRLVNDAFPTVPHEVWPSPGRLLEVLPRIVWHQDEPTAAPGVYSQWHVMEAAAGDVKVLLDGQGADEIFGGYTPYYVDYVRSLGRRAGAAPTISNVRALVQGVHDAHDKLGGGLAKEFVLSFLSEDMKRLLRPLHRKNRTEVQAEYLSQWRPDEDAWAVVGPFDDRLANRLYDALFKKSIPALLRYEDRSSMAFSIEARTPFLDYRIVEFGLALPFDQRIEGEWTKAVLRKAMDGVLPDEVTWRRDKMGYPTPISHWLRGEFKRDAEEIIFSDEFRNRGVFDSTVVREMWRQHSSGEHDYSWNVWRWLSLELWYREFVDG